MPNMVGARGFVNSSAKHREYFILLEEEMREDRVFGYLLTMDLYGVEPVKCQDLNLGY